MENNFNLPINGKKRIVIVGAGFAGLKMARMLSGSKYQVVVLDKQNYHQFQPLFYQVATSGIEPSSISFPVRKVFQNHHNLHFRQTELVKVNGAENTLVTKDGILRYDYLVIATGVGTNYFGSQNIEKHSLPMKTTSEAINLRNRILASYEKAILTEDVAERAKLMSIAVVGGGPTGVELCGALAEMREHVLPKDYPELDFNQMKIFLYEASDRLLNGMSDKSGRDALRFLQALKVEVKLSTKIEDFDGEKISLSGGKFEYIQNLLWTAGVSGRVIDGLETTSYTRAARLSVNEFNLVDNYTNVFAIGDACLMHGDTTFEKGHPQVAQVAIQQAHRLAKNFRLDESKWVSFKYKDKGSMATIGRNMAVVDLPMIHLAGGLAWVMWLFVHLMAIVGVKNRFFIFVNWAQNYFWRDQNLRVLIQPFKRKPVDN